jgi:dolichol-phosphate mannosyltransferase
MSFDPELSVLVVIPTFQEASNIDNVLSQVRTSLPSATVLVVDDNSPDGTADLAEKLAEKLGSIEVLRRAGKSGLGSAYRAGFAWGIDQGYDVLIEMDADLSHNPGDLPRLVQRIEDGADLVVGSRYIPGGAIPGWPAHRSLLSRGGNVYATTVLGLQLKDATSGYRAYRADVLRRIDLDDVKAEGYGFQIEMAYLMARHGAEVREVPITFIDRMEGVSKMSSRIIVEALGLVTFWAIRDRVIAPLRSLGRDRG